jgi:hypothetical protein
MFPHRGAYRNRSARLNLPCPRECGHGTLRTCAQISSTHRVTVAAIPRQVLLVSIFPEYISAKALFDIESYCGCQVDSRLRLRRFMNKVSQIAIITFCSCSFVDASTLVYNGDLDTVGLGALDNTVTPGGGGKMVFDDFTVPAGGWDISSVFSNDQVPDIPTLTARGKRWSPQVPPRRTSHGRRLEGPAFSRSTLC